MSADLLTDPARALPQLAQFLGGYFHQDWPVDRAGWEEVVDDFVSESAPASVSGCAAELRSVIAAQLGDAALAHLLEVLGSELDPSAFGLGPAEWLRAVLDRLPR
jgi:hypothetical protein